MIETGIQFDNIHSFFDLNLILSSVTIPPATPKTTYTDVPGRDGALDQTEAHGEVKYYDRDGCKFTFAMNPASDLSEMAWEDKKTEVSNRLNGRTFQKITLDKDPDYYYSGRCAVSEYLSDKRVRQIVVTARLNPYKCKQDETVKTYELTEDAQTVIIMNSRKSVCPFIECSDDDCKIVFGSASFVLSAGTQKILDIRFTEGENILELSGTGTVTFRFQEADL